MRVAIVGGGIAGLAAAYELELARGSGVDVEWELFEAGGRLGGVIASEVLDGTVIEKGPDSFLTEKPAAAALCRELGLGGELIGSDDARRRTYILVRNRMVPLPDGLMFLVPTKIWPTLTTRLFSWWTKARMGVELLRAPQAAGGDESVAALVERHYGREVVERLADPLLSGIYGGDAGELSAGTVLPRLVAMEAKYGSLTVGMLKGMKAQAEARAKVEAETGEEVVAPPIFTSLRGGLQQLVDALSARLRGGRVRLHSPVEEVYRDGSGWGVRVEGSTEEAGYFDAVILATPAWAAGAMLRGVDGELGGELEAIPYSSSITVNLVYAGDDLDPLPPGFGFLVPAAEGRAMLACTFIHRKFPGRTAAGKTVLRVFLGGVRNASLLGETDAHLRELVERELMEILEISAVPERVEIERWPRAMAQYSVGHGARVRRIQERVGGLPGLWVVGNAYDGIGISDCVRLGRVAARGIVGVRPVG